MEGWNTKELYTNYQYGILISDMFQFIVLNILWYWFNIYTIKVTRVKLEVFRENRENDSVKFMTGMCSFNHLDTVEISLTFHVYIICGFSIIFSTSCSKFQRSFYVFPIYHTVSLSNWLGRNTVNYAFVIQSYISKWLHYYFYIVFHQKKGLGW